MSTQLGLFDGMEERKSKLPRQLRDLDLGGARETMLQLDRLAHPFANLAERLAALQEFKEFLESDDGRDPDRLVLHWEKFATSAATVFSAAENEDLHQGVMKRLAATIGSERTDTLPTGLHPTEVFFHAGRYKQAVQAAIQACRENGENVLLRQIQSAALKKLNKSKASRQVLGMALFHDPRGCRASLLVDEELRTKWETLCTGNSEQAWLELPWHLWQADLLAIGPQPGSFADFLESRLNGAPGQENGSCSENRVTFLRLLFVAEFRRLHGADPIDLMELRLRMKEIDSQRFREYLNKIDQTGNR